MLCGHLPLSSNPLNMVWIGGRGGGVAHRLCWKCGYTKVAGKCARLYNLDTKAGDLP
jgi:hypothetical protein